MWLAWASSRAITRALHEQADQARARGDLDTEKAFRVSRTTVQKDIKKLRALDLNERKTRSASLVEDTIVRLEAALTDRKVDLEQARREKDWKSVAALERVTLEIADRVITLSGKDPAQRIHAQVETVDRSDKTITVVFQKDWSARGEGPVVEGQAVVNVPALPAPPDVSPPLATVPQVVEAPRPDPDEGWKPRM